MRDRFNLAGGAGGSGTSGAGASWRRGSWRSIKEKRRAIKPAWCWFRGGLLHFDRDFEVLGRAGEPLLDVERAHDGGLALGLDLGEFYGVLGVLFASEEDGFGFFRHRYAYFGFGLLLPRRTRGGKLDGVGRV